MSIKYSRQELILTAKQHKEFLIKATWERYSKENGLPSSSTYLRRFKARDWTECVSEIFQGDTEILNLVRKKNRSHYTQEELVLTAKQHKEFFLRSAIWERYSKENGLPSSSTYLRRFKARDWTECVSEIFQGDNEILNLVRKKKLNHYTQENLVLIAKQHKEYFSRRTTWNKYSKENALPTSSTYLRIFKTRRWKECVYAIFKEDFKALDISVSYNMQELVDIAKENQSFFKSPTVWRKHSLSNKLPLVETYQRKFGSWEDAHTHIFGSTEEAYTYITDSWEDTHAHILGKEYELKANLNWEQRVEAKRMLKVAILTKIAHEHKKYFTTRRSWDEYAKEHNLPSTANFKRTFGNWNKAKQALEQPIDQKRTHRKHNFTDKTSLKILALEHPENFTTYEKWDNFAQANNLPSASSYVKYFGSWNKAKEEIGISPVNLEFYSSEKLIDIALEHIKEFTSKKKWDAYAKQHNLPKAYTYRTRFNSWKNAKAVIEEEYNLAQKK